MDIEIFRYIWDKGDNPGAFHYLFLFSQEGF